MTKKKTVEKKPIFVKATKPIGDCPSLWMTLDDSEQILDSKVFKVMVKEGAKYWEKKLKNKKAK